MLQTLIVCGCLAIMLIGIRTAFKDGDMVEKILITVAGLGQCEQMLKMLLQIPVMQKVAITVLHVVPPQVTAEQMAEKLQEGGRILAKAIENLKIAPERVKALLIQGEPKDTVCQVAIDEQADLLIMGSRGMSRLESILSNSVSQYVFQLSSCSMLLVKDDVFVKQLNRIMVAYDNSAPAKAALDTALSLLRDNKGGQLILARTLTDQKAADAFIAEKDEKLAPAISAAKQMGINYKIALGDGNPGKEICRLADEFNADLLLLGSPDRRPSIARTLPDLDRLLGNSISDYVRVHAPCPILLARTAG
jgi:nucleotide-binding universal stress UspA family protein